MKAFRAQHDGQIYLVHCAWDLSAAEFSRYLDVDEGNVTVAEAHMDEWTERQWEAAERREPTQVYIGRQ